MGPVRRTAPILADDLRFLLAESDRPVNVTLPGPMIVVDSTLDEHYGDEEAMAVAAALDEEACELGRMGAAVIQSPRSTAPPPASATSPAPSTSATATPCPACRVRSSSVIR